MIFGVPFVNDLHFSLSIPVIFKSIMSSTKASASFSNIDCLRCSLYKLKKFRSRTLKVSVKYCMPKYFSLHLCSTLWLEHIFLDIFSNLLCSISCFLDFFFEILFPKIISIFFVKNVVLSTFHFKELNHYNYFLFPKFVAKFLFQILLEFQNYLY